MTDDERDRLRVEVDRLQAMERRLAEWRSTLTSSEFPGDMLAAELAYRMDPSVDFAGPPAACGPHPIRAERDRLRVEVDYWREQTAVALAKACTGVSEECAIRERCTNKCGRLQAMDDALPVPR